MLKTRKRIFIVFAVIVCIVICGVLLTNIFSPLNRISRYISKNHDEIERVCKDYLERGISAKEYDGIKIDGVFGTDQKIVQFFYSGFGIAPASKYYGFYYSPDDVPAPYCFDDYELSDEGKYRWSWNGKGDNGGMVRKICDNFYYYEAWF